MRQGGTAKEIAADLGVTRGYIAKIARDRDMTLDSAYVVGENQRFLKTLEVGQVKYFPSHSRSSCSNVVTAARNMDMTVMGRTEGKGVWIGRIR